MKKLFLGLFIASGLLLASGTNFIQANFIDGYKINLSSNTPLVTGSNDVFINIYKDKKEVTNVKTKIRFFMPEMPGMPYMESKARGKLEKDSYKFVVNFGMSGTWQYIFKFKDENGKVRKIRSSVNL